MAIMLPPPKWFTEGTLPAPTKPKNKYLNKVAKAAPVDNNAQFFNIVNNLYNQGSWIVDVEAPAPSFTEGEWLYKQRQEKHALSKKLSPNRPWETVTNFTKQDWQEHALKPAGQWEKQVYDTNTYIPYEQWYEQIYGFAPPSMFNSTSVKPTRKIRVLNRPGETIER